MSRFPLMATAGKSLPVWLFIFLFYHAAAQKHVPAPGKTYDVKELMQHLTEHNVHFTDTSLDKYCGTWQAQNGDSLVTFTIAKSMLNTAAFMKYKWKIDLLRCTYSCVVKHGAAVPPAIVFTSTAEKQALSQTIAAPVTETPSTAAVKEVEYAITLEGNSLLLTRLNKVKEGIAYHPPAYFPGTVVFTKWLSLASR